MPLELVDCHFHFYNQNINQHPFLEHYEPKLANMWGESYDTKLPKVYLPEDYFKDMGDLKVNKLVMAELVSTNPVKEMQFAQDLAQSYSQLAGAIANISLLDPKLVLILEEYSTLPIVRSVRDHLLWDPDNSNNCYTSRANILTEPKVSSSFALIQKYQFPFEFEVYAHEIPHVLNYARKFPDMNFLLHCLGWPLDKTIDGFKQWATDMRHLAECPNVYVKITAIECIFGLNWSVEQISPWIQTTIEFFGAKRCMFGSHLPITKLSQGVETLYQAYQTSTAQLNEDEQKYIFAETAKIFYQID